MTAEGTEWTTAARRVLESTSPTPTSSSTIPDSLTKLARGNTVVVPYPVVRELDGLKDSLNGVGMAARRVARMLDTFQEGKPSSVLASGIPMPDGGHLVFDDNLVPKEDTWDGFDPRNNDDRIIGIARKWIRQRPDARVSLVTRDVRDAREGPPARRERRGLPGRQEDLVGRRAVSGHRDHHDSGRLPRPAHRPPSGGAARGGAGVRGRREPAAARQPVLHDRARRPPARWRTRSSRPVSRPTSASSGSRTATAASCR